MVVGKLTERTKFSAVSEDFTESHQTLFAPPFNSLVRKEIGTWDVNSYNSLFSGIFFLICNILGAFKYRKCVHSD